MYLNVEQLNIRALLAIFFNFKYIKKYSDEKFEFKVYSSCRKSKYAPETLELSSDIVSKNNNSLSNWTGLNFSINKSESSYVFHYTGSKDALIKNLYKEIQKKRINITDDEFELYILLSLFTLRGSIDVTANYFSVDILRKSQTEEYLDFIFKLLTNISNLNQLNLNFRELQKDFTDNNISRNTQIRINLKYFCDKLGYDISCTNVYRNYILQNVKNKISTKDYNKKIVQGFVERLMIYRSKIINNSLYTEATNKQNYIHSLRQDLGFYYNNTDKNNNRNTNLINIARELYPDECVCCKDKYNIEDRSFKMKKTGRYYLEIHHVISFASDKRGDQIDNLVKVCPACHRALTKNRATEEYQKTLIKNILLNSVNAREYISNFIDGTDDKKINYVYEHLQ